MLRRVFSLTARAGLLALSLTGGACVGYDQRVCDDPNARACDPHVVPPQQQLRDLRQEDRAARPQLLSPVALENVVVTAVDNYLEGPRGDTGDIWVQERVLDPNFRGCAPHPEGGRVCGIQIFAATFIPAGARALPGDLVDITGGEYQEFDCTPCCAPPRPPCTFSDGRTLPEISFSTVERVGSARVPDPIPVTLADIANGGDAYMGVLVRVTDTLTLGAPDTRGEYAIGMNINLTQELTPLIDNRVPNNMGAPLAEGTRVTNVVGIVSYFFGPKLIPRTTADYTIVP